MLYLDYASLFMHKNTTDVKQVIHENVWWSSSTNHDCNNRKSPTQQLPSIAKAGE